MRRELGEAGFTADAALVANISAGVASVVGGIIALWNMGRLDRRKTFIIGLSLTTTCHVLIGEELREVEGMCGVVEDGIVPGYYGYELGQSGVGDIFAWYLENGVPPAYHERAAREGLTLHALLEREARAQRPGERLIAGLGDMVAILAVEIFDMQRDPGMLREGLEPLAEQLGVHLADL